MALFDRLKNILESQRTLQRKISIASQHVNTKGGCFITLEVYLKESAKNCQ